MRATRHVELLAFCVADTHVHFVLRGDREPAGRAIQAFEAGIARSRRLAEGFAPAHFEAIRTQAHFLRAFWYAARQDLHHGTRRDPFLDGNLLADQVGLRLVDPRAWGRVRADLPRVRMQELVALAGEIAAGAPRRSAVDAIVEGASAVIGGRALPIRTALGADLRSAALIVGVELEVDEGRLAERLGIAPNTLSATRRRVPRSATLLAVRGQALLRLGMLDELAALLLAPR